MTLIEQDDVTGLLAAQPEFSRRIVLGGQTKQYFGHIFIAHRRLDQLKVVFSGILMQGPVCHDGCYKRIGEQFVLLMQRVCQDCQHVVAVNQLTSLIH